MNPSNRSRGLGLLSLTAVSILPVLPTPAGAAPPWPFARERSAVERIADRIDDLEEDLERYGSVVAKQPDVWGEARLTKYRVEYEQQMAKRAGGFRDTLNASLSRSDQLYLSAALALNDAPAAGATELPSGASSGVVNLITAPPGAGTEAETEGGAEAGVAAAVARTPGVLQSVGGGAFAGLAAGTQTNVDATTGLRIEPVLSLQQQDRYLNRLHQLRRTNEGDDTSDSPGYALNLIRIPVSVLPGDRTRTGWGAEMTVTVEPYLSPELLPRTFRDLVVNDVTDRIGLSLTRFVNEGPGGGQDAVNILDSYIELRDAAVGLGTQLVAVERQRAPGFSLTLPEDVVAKLRDANSISVISPNIPVETTPVRPLPDLGAAVSRGPRVREIENRLFLQPMSDPAEADGGGPSQNYLRALERFAEPGSGLRALGAPGLDSFEEPPGDASGAIQVGPAGVLPVLHQTAAPSGEAVGFRSRIEKLPPAELISVIRQVDFAESQLSPGRERLSQREARLLFKVAADLLIRSVGAGGENEGAADLAESAVPLGRDRRARFSLSGNQLLPVYGFAPVGQILKNVLARAGHTGRGAKFVHYDDVAGLLREELAAAYELFDARPDLLQTFVTPELHRAVRELRHPDGLLENALAFDPRLSGYLKSYAGVQPPEYGDSYVAQQRALFFAQFPEDQRRNPIVALAWGIIVESALLNERLADDIREQASLKGCGCSVPPEGLPFFLPHPPPEAVAAFEEYVRCRWPIHTFALDPVTDDQNIADAFSQRRETQLALSVALSNGTILPQTFSRLARRTELDAATIALNRPVVGFAHGSDTFGWRIRPRFQTPEIEGTIPAAFGALVGAPTRDYLLSQRQIEPGQRDLTAVVLMPSFVPYATFHFRSNWFRLRSPDRKAFDLETSAELGRELLGLRQAAGCLPGAHHYRPEDVGGLHVALDQLEKRLPTQTTQVQIPHENTLGGFELFSAGVTDLAPELKGFYGAPGFVYDTDDGAPATVIYVVGDSFSVHETRVIAGNRDVTDYAVTAAIPVATPSGEVAMTMETGPKTRLLSRQVMQVVIPAHAQPEEEDGKWLDLHVATPYGVSNHLRIPVIPGPAAAAAVAVAAAVQTAEEAKALAARAAVGLAGGPGSGFQFAQTELVADTNLIPAAEGFAPCLKIDPNRGATRIAVAVPDDGIPFGNPTAQLAAFVVPLVDGAETPRFQKPLGPVDLEENAIPLNLMEAKLAEVIAAQPDRLAAAEALRVYGYVRFVGDGRPAFQLAEPLTLTLRRPGEAGYCLCPRCPTGGATDAAGGANDAAGEPPGGGTLTPRRSRPGSGGAQPGRSSLEDTPTPPPALSAPPPVAVPAEGEIVPIEPR